MASELVSKVNDTSYDILKLRQEYEDRLKELIKLHKNVTIQTN